MRGAEKPEKVILSNISACYEQSSFTSSCTSPLSPKSKGRKEVEADEEQATQNVINFNKPVKLYIITRKKEIPQSSQKNNLKFPPTSR